MMERIAVRRKTLKGTTKNKWMIFSLVAVVIVFSGVFYIYKTKQSVSKETVIQTSTMGTGNIILSATGLGTLIPNQEVSFGFKQSGQVSEVLATLGEKVEAGQVLARLDSKTLELQYKNRQCRMPKRVLQQPKMICNS